MEDFNEFNEDLEIEEEEQELHYFCKLTFGQFFTLMVLEIITLGFVFYLGARYGNEYLRLDTVTESQSRERKLISNVDENVLPEELRDNKEIQKMARDVIERGKVDLKSRVEEILAREQGPTTPPIGEPESYDGSDETGDLLQKREFGYDQDDKVANEELSYEELRSRLETEKESGNEVVKVKSTGNAKYSVQVGAYPSVKEASYRVEEWKAKGYPAYMMIADLGEKGEWYRVRIGAFADQDAADKYRQEMVDKEGISDAFVVKNEQ